MKDCWTAPLGTVGRGLVALLLAGAGICVWMAWRGDGAALVGGVVIAACGVFTARLRVVAQMGEGSLVVRMAPFPAFTLAYEDIVSAAPADPALKAAGLGYRMLGPGDRALLTGGPALTVRYVVPGQRTDTFHPPRQLTFSTPAPGALVDAVRQRQESLAAGR